MSSPSHPVRLLLVDDHPAVLRQTMQLLPEEFEVVGALESGAELSGLVQETSPDIILLDITLPRVSGIDLARALRQTRCAARIVFLTVHADADYAQAAFAAGGDGYVIKPRLATDLVPALRTVLAGRRFVSPCLELQGL
jgi:DNA-binding NarL/FixJ family response regulator